MSFAPAPVSRLRLEFRTTLLWRFIIITVISVADVALSFARSGEWVSRMLPWYAAYGAIVALMYVVYRQRGEASGAWLLPLGMCVDLVAAAVIHHRGGGGFWHGPVFYALVVLVASAVLSPRGVVTVTTAAIAVFATKTYLESAGIWGWDHVSAPTRAFFGTPGYATDHFVLGTVALIALAVIQRKLVRRIQRAESEQRAIVDATPDLLMTFDQTGKVLSANTAAVATLGAAARPGVTFDLVHLALNSHDDALRAFASAGRGDASRVDASISLASRRTRQFSITFTPIFDEGAVRAVLASGRDVTDERTAIAEREELHRQLEESRRMQLVGRLVSGVAHELNNPLSAILNHAELMRDASAQPSRDLDDGLDIIRGEARRAREIVRDLLQVARADSHRLRSEVSLQRLACDVVAALEPVAELHEVALSCTPAPEMPLVVVDATGISQVVTNLVMNAIDASAPQGNVVVSVSADDENARIVVQDDGPGIAPNVQAHLFEPFVTTKAPGNGTGLGLAVSLGIVEQHNGKLFAEDVRPHENRRGARFTVVLPLRDIGVAHPNDDSLHASTEANGEDESLDLFSVLPAHNEVIAQPVERRVLIVDDEPAIRSGLQRWFTREGWTVRTVSDGIEALEALRLSELEGTHMNAIICDLRMPRMGGPEFYARLERSAPQLTRRIIFSTGDIVSEDVRTFLASVDVPVLEKPFEFRALAQKLAELDGGAASLQEHESSTMTEPHTAR